MLSPGKSCPFLWHYVVTPLLDINMPFEWNDNDGRAGIWQFLCYALACQNKPAALQNSLCSLKFNWLSQEKSWNHSLGPNNLFCTCHTHSSQVPYMEPRLCLSHWWGPGKVGLGRLRPGPQDSNSKQALAQMAEKKDHMGCQSFGPPQRALNPIILWPHYLPCWKCTNWNTLPENMTMVAMVPPHYLGGANEGKNLPAGNR
jgi:hypothetical protein